MSTAVDLSAISHWYLFVFSPLLTPRVSLLALAER